MIEIIRYQELFNQLNKLIDAHQSMNKDFALLLVRPEKLRQINLARGYEMGDRVLQLVYDKLTGISRGQFPVHRVGGAQFLFIIQNLHSPGHASLAATRINSELTDALINQEDIPKFELSIGITVYPEHAQNAESLYSLAEQTLNDARNSVDRFLIYSNHYRTPLMSWDLSADLEAAIDNDQFELVFQPQISFDTNRVCGAEALIRWNHPQQGSINTELFIAQAEKTHLIVDITDWTLRNALWQSTQWPKGEGPLSISVNLSPKAMEEEGLVSSLINAARIFDAEPSCLTLEVTETALMEDAPAKINVLKDLKAEGVKISIDDFGTGYSSMEYLKMLPADELKIDKSFVFNMLENEMDLHIVRSIIDIARGFGLKVVAEGIGDVETYKQLQSMGCDQGQGYYISRPLAQHKLIEWVKQYSEVCNVL